ncbi:hypothetical protein D3C73_1109500 [compost metagenome]
MLENGKISSKQFFVDLLVQVNVDVKIRRLNEANLLKRKQKTTRISGFLHAYLSGYNNKSDSFCEGLISMTSRILFA